MIYQGSKLIGCRITSDSKAEAELFRWMWEHEFRIEGFSQGIEQNQTQLAIAISPVKREMFPKREQPVTTEIKHSPKDGQQEKMF